MAIPDNDIFMDKEIEDAEIVSEEPAKAQTIFVVDTADGFSASAEPLAASILSEDKAKNHVRDTSIVKVYERSIVTSAGLSLGGQRLLRVVLSLITPQDKANKRYSFYIDDYKKVFNMAEYPIQQLKIAAAELLVPREFNMSGKADEFSMSGLISQITVKGGVATFSVAEDLLPVYQSLREKNEYLLGYTKEFSCSYSFAFYELFLEKLGSNTENPNSVTIYYKLEKLQEWLKLGNKYVDPRTGRLAYAGFKRKVLVPVMNDINRTTEDGPYCNINFDLAESKVGRRVVGIEFTIWRASSIIKEQPVVNKFYTKLSPDVKLAYDALIALDIKQSEIESCIIRNKEQGFLEIFHFIAKQKFKGTAHISSILRNDLTDFSLGRSMNIRNIQRAYNISDAEQKRYDETEEIIRAFDASDKITVNGEVKKFLLENEPYIYKHLDGMALDEILDTRDLKIFYLEMFSHILLNQLSKDVVRIYRAHFDEAEKKGILAATSSKVCEAFEKYGVNKSVWPDFAKYPEDYILANIDYCVKKYKKGKGQSNIAGVIVKAIKLDYAGFNLSQKKKELERARNELQYGVPASMPELFVPEEIAAAGDGIAVPAGKASSKPAKEKAGMSSKNVSSNSAEPAVEEAYNAFVTGSDEEAKDRLKMKAVGKMNDFQKTVICGIVNRDREEPTDDLGEVSVDVLLKIGIFEKTYRKVFVEELGL